MPLNSLSHWVRDEAVYRQSSLSGLAETMKFCRFICKGCCSSNHLRSIPLHYPHSAAHLSNSKRNRVACSSNIWWSPVSLENQSFRDYQYLTFDPINSERVERPAIGHLIYLTFKFIGSNVVCHREWIGRLTKALSAALLLFSEHCSSIRRQSRGVTLQAHLTCRHRLDANRKNETIFFY